MSMTRANKIRPEISASTAKSRAAPPMATTLPMANRKRADFDAIPTPNYSKLSERLRQSTNPQFQCAMFCGGRKCKYETSSNWSDQNKALPGIFSHWVTDDILAMARPNTASMHTNNLIHYFHENNIKSIINLEEPGEHANCGNALSSSGFSYEPTYFMENNVYFYNFQWRDYSIVSDEVLLDMVKVMTFALTEGKVAIHCHAGLGRTGVLIAAYLVFTFRCRPQEAIRFVRSKRPNAIQTRGQILCVLQFAKYILPFFVVYPHVIPRQLSLTCSQLLMRQRLLLHGYQLRHLKYLPKILYVICERLLNLCGKSKIFSRGIAKNSCIQNSQIGINFRIDSTDSFYKHFFSAAYSATQLTRDERPQSNMTIQLSSGIASPETALLELNSSTNTSRNSTADSKRRRGGGSRKEHVIGSTASTSMHSQSFLLPPVKECPNSFSDKSDLQEKIDCDFAPIQQISQIGLDTPKKSRTPSSTSSDEPNSVSPSDSVNSLIEKAIGCRVLHIDSSHILYEQDFERVDHKSGAYNSKLLESDGTQEDGLENFNDYDEDEDEDAQCSSGFLSSNCGNISEDDDDIEVIDCAVVEKALALDYSSHAKSFLNALTKYQKELNNKPFGWDRLSRETDAEMLCALLWSWIENLREPILNKNSLCYIVIKAEQPLDALLRLDQTIRYTVEYLIRFIARLNPDEEIRDKLLRYLMAYLTKQRLKLSDSTLVPNGRDWPEMRKGTAGKVMLFTNGIYQLLY